MIPVDLPYKNPLPDIIPETFVNVARPVCLTGLYYSPVTPLTYLNSTDKSTPKEFLNVILYS